MQRRLVEISTYRGMDKDPAAKANLRRDVAAGPSAIGELTH
jgi:hypothetical protein